MIVGRKFVDLTELEQHTSSLTQLSAYSLSLIPRYAHHIPAIVDNQRYIVAINVRKLKTLSYKRRKDLYNGLLRGTHIKGLINSVIEIEDILTDVSMTKLLKGVFKDLLTNPDYDEM